MLVVMLLAKGGLNQVIFLLCDFLEVVLSSSTLKLQLVLVPRLVQGHLVVFSLLVELFFRHADARQSSGDAIRDILDDGGWRGDDWTVEKHTWCWNWS